jgi:hypothetical protein
MVTKHGADFSQQMVCLVNDLVGEICDDRVVVLPIIERNVVGVLPRRVEGLSADTNCPAQDVGGLEVGVDVAEDAVHVVSYVYFGRPLRH